MSLSNTPDGYGDSPKRRPRADAVDGTGQESGIKGLELYDRKAEPEWQETFGIEPKGHRRHRRREESATINLSDPYEAEAADAPQQRRPRERVKPVEEPTALAMAGADRKGSRSLGNSGESPERVPIREAMNTIRAIIARVKGGGSVGADDLSALGAAFDQLGAAALECKAVHNWPELKFISHVRSLLGSYLGKKVPDSLTSLPRMELAESGVLADEYKGGSRSKGQMRFELDSAGALAGSKGTGGEVIAGLPRVDIDMSGSLAHTSFQTLESKPVDHVEMPRVVLGEESGRISSGSQGPNRTDVSLRMSTLDQIGVLISQREQAAKSVT